MDADGIGVDDEISRGGTEAHQSVLLLEPTEQQAEKDTDNSTDGGDQSALEEEDTDDLTIAGTEVTESDHIVFLIDDQHGEGTDDIETGHHEDKGEEDIGNKLLDLHDLKGVVLLFVAVAHDKLRSTKTLDLGLDSIEIAAGLEAQLQRGEHALLTEDTTGKGNAGDDIVLVVLSLFDVEKHSWRIKLVFLEGLFGICDIKLTFSARRIDLQRVKMLRMDDFVSASFR